MPTQMPRKGRPERAAARVTSSSPAARSASMHAPKAPTPGSTTASAASIVATSAVSEASAPTVTNALCAEWRFPMP